MMHDIVYVMGTGRSGTTILDVLLSNNAGHVGCGEITHLFGSSVIEDDCACGISVANCSVWASVLREFSSSEREKVDTLLRAVEAHSAFFLVIMGLFPSVKLTEYNRVNEKVYGTLFHQGFKVVVDSSKYAARALLLAVRYKKRVKVICLTRSPEGLLNAFAKRDTEQPPKSVLGTMLYYVYTMICFAIVRWKLQGQVVMIRYEDMIADPVSTLNKVEDKLGLNLESSLQCLMDGQPLDTGHIAVGNRLRRQDKVYFRQGCKHEQVKGLAVPASIFMRGIGKILGFNPYRFTGRDL